MELPKSARPLAVAVFIIAAISASGAQGAAPGPARPLSIAGSGSNIPLTQRLLDAYGLKKGQTPRIPPSIGTAGAITALQAGQLDLGLISRPLKDAELASGIRQRAYARIGIVLGVNPSVPDSSISSGELVSIYTGAKNAWQNGSMIIVLAREAGDSSNAVLEKSIPGFSQAYADSFAKKRWEVYYTDGEENDAIATTSDALGLTDTVAIVLFGKSIKALRFDGVEPSAKTLSDGTYPLRKDLFFAYREPLSDEARAFVDFTFSAEGRAIVSGLGALPVARN